MREWAVLVVVLGLVTGEQTVCHRLLEAEVGDGGGDTLETEVARNENTRVVFCTTHRGSGTVQAITTIGDHQVAAGKLSQKSYFTT